MAHKKKTSYKDVGKTLKDLGFIDYDLRRNLNSGQKSQITKLARQYSQLIRNPKDFHVQAAPKGTREGLRTAGFTVNKGGKVIVPKYEYERVTVRRGHVTLQKGGKREDIYLAGSKQFFDKLKNLNETKKKLARNQMLTVQIGDNNAFSSRFRSYWELYQYLTKFQPKDEGESREKLFARMSIVTIEDTTKAKSKRTRSKGYGQRKDPKRRK
jgi:hypothetical protein